MTLYFKVEDKIGKNFSQSYWIGDVFILNVDQYLLEYDHDSEEIITSFFNYKISSFEKTKKFLKTKFKLRRLTKKEFDAYRVYCRLRNSD